MFDKRYRRYIQSLLLVLPMTGVVTAINMFIAKGWEGLLSVAIFQRWGISILIAFPAVLIIAPLASKTADYLIRDNQ